MKLFRGVKWLHRTNKTCETVGTKVTEIMTPAESYYCEYGIRDVSPADVVELSLPYHQVINDSKMQWLREKVNKEG